MSIAASADPSEKISEATLHSASIAKTRAAELTRLKGLVQTLPMTKYPEGYSASVHDLEALETIGEYKETIKRLDDENAEVSRSISYLIAQRQ